MLDLKPYGPEMTFLSDMRLMAITGAIIYVRLCSDLLKLQGNICIMTGLMDSNLY